jgi:signal transduction histidine kinase
MPAMSSSFDTICKNMASSLESSGAGNPREAKSDTVRQISPVVAHELNNLLTIIQGYADRLLIKHGENPAIEAKLKLISEASRRAATLVRSAAQPAADKPQSPQPHSPPLVPAA